jgi:hypothetical protein
MAERDGMWPGGEVSARKPPPDLGTRSRCRNDQRVSIHETHVRVIRFPLLANWALRT